MKTLEEICGVQKTETRCCETHGEYESRQRFERWSCCPACSEEQRKAEEQARQEADARKAAERWEMALGAAMIPLRFQTRTLDSYVVRQNGQESALEFAKRYAEDFPAAHQTGRSAIFTGRPGTGKTHLAAGIALHVMKNFRAKVLFSTVSRAIRRVKDTWNTHGERESDAIALMTEPDLLILDEVGVQFGSQTEKNILFDILNERYENTLPCILISNLPVNELTQFIGERVYDRLKEGGGKCIVFDWESERKAA